MFSIRSIKAFTTKVPRLFGVSEHKSPYILLKKISESPIGKFPKDSWTVPEEAKTFNFVEIGKRADPAYNCEIVSFYDKDGNIIQRYQKGTDIPRKSRKHTYDFMLTKDKESLNIRRIKTTEYLNDGKGDYNWQHVSDEDQFVNTNYNVKKGTHCAKKVQINKTLYGKCDDGDNISVTMTEYPTTLGLEPKSAKKMMGVDMVMKDGIPYIYGTNQTLNVKFPTDDDFLAFRFLQPQAKQEALAKYFLKQKGLDKANVTIITSVSDVAENSSACFRPDAGIIFFKDVPRYTSPADTAAHEVEHAYQHSQIGRLTSGRTDYEKRCHALFKPIVDKKEESEAFEYLCASESYPILTKNEDLVLNKDYMENYMEIKAREAGEKADEKYRKGRDFLMNQFRYLPDGNIL